MKMNSEMQYGIVCGIAMSAWVLIEFALGFHTTDLDIGQYSGFVSFIFPVVFIFAALHNRQRITGSPLTLFDGINTGFKISFFSAILLTFFFFFYTNFINPDWLELTIEWQRKQLILSGAGDDEIGRFMDQNSQLNSSPAQLIMGFISATGLGVLITLIEIPVIKYFFKNT